MGKIKDLSGKTFGQLKVISFHHSGGLTGAYWYCQCECGKTKIARAIYLSMGKTKSCGCLLLTFGWRFRTHGDTKSKEHATWTGMRQRCYDKNSRNYRKYGERGIKICDRWMESYENFLMDMGRAPSKKHSIERINNNGDYEPTNCRWATSIEQQNNTRKNVNIEYNGEIKTRAEWCRIFNLDYFKVRYRLQKGWSLDRTFRTP